MTVGLTAAIAKGGVVHSQEYEIDLSDLEKKPYTFGGFVEAEPILFGLDRDSASYELRFSDEDLGGTTGQYSLGVRLEGSYEKGPFYAGGRFETFLTNDYRGWDESFAIQEGYVSYKPSLNFTLDVGKRVNKWGTGYFRNPVSFVDRQKDPEDPQEALEGFYGVKAEVVKSFAGPLKTLTVTPVLLPVTEDINADFGQRDHVNFATKVYLLLWNTDIDFVFFTGGSRAQSVGLDFARNITSNFEIHGEMAWFKDFERRFPSPGGGLETERSTVPAGLIGIRYLTTSLTTFIVEYYHNGGGLREEETTSFYRRVHEAAANDELSLPSGLQELKAAVGVPAGLVDDLQQGVAAHMEGAGA